MMPTKAAPPAPKLENELVVQRSVQSKACRFLERRAGYRRGGEASIQPLSKSGNRCGSTSTSNRCNYLSGEPAPIKRLADEAEAAAVGKFGQGDVGMA